MAGPPLLWAVGFIMAVDVVVSNQAFHGPRGMTFEKSTSFAIMVAIRAGGHDERLLVTRTALNL